MQNFSLTTSKVKDNIQFFKENSESDYVKTIRSIIKSDPFLGNKFYIHSFIKRVDDISGIKKMYHHPRLTKPDPTPGASLLRVDPKQPEEMKVMWTIPNQETFGLYKYKKAFADQFVYECIQTYKKNPSQLSKPESDDLTDQQCRDVYQTIKERRQKETGSPIPSFA
jgi:hypothetical protein